MCCFIVLETWVNRHERSATTENLVRVLEEADLYGEDVAAILKPSEEHQEQQEASNNLEGKKDWNFLRLFSLHINETILPNFFIIIVKHRFRLFKKKIKIGSSGNFGQIFKR